MSVICEVNQSKVHIGAGDGLTLGSMHMRYSLLHRVIGRKNIQPLQQQTTDKRSSNIVEHDTIAIVSARQL